MSGRRSYEIRLRDQPLLGFSIADGAFEEEVSLDWVAKGYDGLMPCGLSPDPEGVWRWLEVRSIPANRKNAQVICHELGFALGDVEALYRASLGLSLNDSYWVVPAGFEGGFDDFNLYENPFSEAIGALAVAGEVRGSRLAGNTPELTTDGTLRKGWRIVGDRRVLYKGATEGYAPGEPVSEYIASLVCQDLGLDVVEYGLDTWEGELCSTCEDFASKDVSYVPFAVATGQTDLAGALWWLGSRDPEWLERLCDMLALDALLCNVDRHLANFGLLRDNATGKALGLAPIFDNGRSLFPNVADDDTSQFALESQLRGPAFGGSSFEQLLSRIMGDRQRALIERALERGIIGNVEAPTRRVAALDSYLRERARSLLEIPPVDHGALMDALAQAVSRRPQVSDGVFRLSS